MSAIWAIGNPRKRRGRKGKRRSAAQKRATAAMLAANGRIKRRGKRRGRPAGKRRSRRTFVASAPRRSYRRSRRGGGRSASFNTNSAISLLKAGAIGGAGAVAVDIAMGYTSRMLQTAAPSLATPANADGTPNYAYYGIKAGLAVALGTFGKRIIPAPIADRMAEGALTVLAYQFIRPMVPAGIALGNINPAPVQRRLSGAGAYVSAYQQVPVRSSGARNGTGSRAAQVVNLRNR